MLSELRRKALLAELVKKLNAAGSWTGETHVQKTAYVLQELDLLPTGYEYILYKHGPYSFDLRDELGELTALNLISLVPKPASYGPSFGPSFRTDRQFEKFAKIFGKTIQENTKGWNPIIDWPAPKGVSELEKVVTALYVIKTQQTEDLGELAEGVISRKPHITSGDAVRAIEEVQERMKAAQY